MPFETVYTVRRGDNLTSIGRSFGFQNPGPIYAYPGNRGLFANRGADLLRPGEVLRIPYPPGALQKFVALSRELTRGVTETAQRMITRQRLNQRELERFLVKIELAGFLASLGVSIGSLAVAGMRGVEMSGKEALIWLTRSRLETAASITTMVVSAPSAPKIDFRFFVRHTLGRLTPSYWASVGAAVLARDLDLFLYGADAVTYRVAMRIKRQADKDIARLTKRTREAEKQLAMPYYRHRI